MLTRHQNAILAALYVATSAASCSRDAQGSPAIPEAAPPPTGSTSPRAPATPTPVELISTKTTLRDAFEFAQPQMHDAMNEISDGSALFTIWAAKHLTWTELNALGETKFSLVHKDSDTFRGQRICRSARIIQIKLIKLDVGRFFEGLFMTSDRDIGRFAAVRSTGELVQGSWARFCGVVIGNYSYSNSGGGTSHAVDMVGMFDLPENKLEKTQ